jgi:PIN domain nuclease of toxin-antitoxin system
VRYLIDTRVLLWWLDDSPTLSQAARDTIAGGDNTVYVSAATIWEIVIKVALGKLDVPLGLRDAIADAAFECLDITADHAFSVAELPDHHRDPFDRILIAQCRVEDLTFITRDEHARRYDVRVLEA